jgi:hypothetical protein
METRTRVIEPLIPPDRPVFYGFDPDRYRGEPYGIGYSLITVSTAHRQRRLAADDAGWQQLARRLRRRPLPTLVTVELAPLDGSGRLSRHGGRARVAVWPTGSTVPDRGWFVSAGVSDTLPAAAGMARIERSLLDAAIRWSAVAPATAGYVSVDETTDPSPISMSPWEAATLAHFTPPHPTTTTRGVHWATYLTAPQWAAVQRAWARLPADVTSHALRLDVADHVSAEEAGPNHVLAGRAADVAAGHGAWLTLGDDAHAPELPGKAALEEILAPWLPVIPAAGFAYLDRG